MKLQHTFGYDCEDISSLIVDNKLSIFFKKLIILGKQQDPDLYDPLLFMGDGFEWFVEYFFKFFNGDHTLTYTADYEPNLEYDCGIDGRGLSTLDGKPNFIQCKFKDPTKYLTNEDNISNVAASAMTNEGLQYNGKNIIIVTSCKGVHPKHAMANVHCIDGQKMARRVDNNVIFWDNLRSIVEEQYAQKYS